MAQQHPTITFEDISVEQARTTSRGPRMDPELYHALKEKIQSLSDTAPRFTLPEETRLDTMKNRLLRVAAELGVPVTIRKVPGGLIFWRSTAEDLDQAQQVTARLQSARQPPQAAPRGHRCGAEHGSVAAPHGPPNHPHGFPRHLAG